MYCNSSFSSSGHHPSYDSQGCCCSNMSAPELCCSTDISTCQSQDSTQLLHKNVSDSNFMSDINRSNIHRRTINLPLTSPNVIVSQHVSLCRSHSQPLIHRDRYSHCSFYFCKSDEHLYHPKGWQIFPGNKSHTHPDERLQQWSNERTHASPSQLLTCTKPVPVFGIPKLSYPSPAGSLGTGLTYDWHMHAGRLRDVWLRLQKCGLIAQCEVIQDRAASMEISSCLNSSGTTTWSNQKLDEARISAETVINLALLVSQGKLKNGFAMVSQFKHHDELDSSLSVMSPFSSVALAAKELKQCVERILIVDWDVHHCHTIQELFYTDPRVLCISLHQYFDPNARPKTGNPNEVGLGEGEGFNVNVQWSGTPDSPIGDTEYLEAFKTVVMPIAHEFSPDIVLVSSEFNAVDGHPASHGGHRVSAECFGVLTHKLLELAMGRVIVVLECSHDLTTVCDASEECINALLHRKTTSLSEDVLKKKPCANAIQSLQKVLQIQSRYWPSLRCLTHTGSYLETERKCSSNNGAHKDLSSLSLDHNEPVEHDENELFM